MNRIYKAMLMTIWGYFSIIIVSLSTQAVAPIWFALSCVSLFVWLAILITKVME